MVYCTVLNSIIYISIAGLKRWQNGGCIAVRCQKSPCTAYIVLHMFLCLLAYHIHLLTMSLCTSFICTAPSDGLTELRTVLVKHDRVKLTTYGPILAFRISIQSAWMGFWIYLISSSLTPNGYTTVSSLHLCSVNWFIWQSFKNLSYAVQTYKNKTVTVHCSDYLIDNLLPLMRCKNYVHLRYVVYRTLGSGKV
jgi:hypothetical protein